MTLEKNSLNGEEETLQQCGRPSDMNVFSQQLKKNTQEHDLPKRRAIMLPLTSMLIITTDSRAPRTSASH